MSLYLFYQVKMSFYITVFEYAIINHFYSGLNIKVLGLIVNSFSESHHRKSIQS
jgi:hypothetical protein